MGWNARQYRFLWIGVAIIVVAVLLYLIRAALFPFVLGVALAYVLHPFVSSLEKLTPLREKWPSLNRVIAILIVYSILVGFITFVVIIVIPPAFDEASGFASAIPELLSRAIVTVEGWNERYADMIPSEFRQEVQDLLQNASSILIEAVRNIITRTLGAVSRALTVVIGLAIVPLFLYYLLKDKESLLDGFTSLFPESARHHIRSVAMEVNDVIGSYVRAQLLLGFIVGFFVWLGLFVLDVPFSVLLGIVAGVFELIPIIGPWLGAIPGILVTLATSPEDLIWVLLLYLGIQLAENSFLVPRVHSESLNLHPVVIMIVIVIGSEVAGLWGVILGPPLTAAALRIYYYFRQEADEKLEVKEAEVALIEEPLEQETYVEIPESEVYERGDE